jgi:hypothetical protein
MLRHLCQVIPVCIRYEIIGMDNGSLMHGSTLVSVGIDWVASVIQQRGGDCTSITGSLDR